MLSSATATAVAAPAAVTTIDGDTKTRETVVKGPDGHRYQGSCVRVAGQIIRVKRGVTNGEVRAVIAHRTMPIGAAAARVGRPMATHRNTSDLAAAAAAAAAAGAPTPSIALGAEDDVPPHSNAAETNVSSSTDIRTSAVIARPPPGVDVAQEVDILPRICKWRNKLRIANCGQMVTRSDSIYCDDCIRRTTQNPRVKSPPWALKCHCTMSCCPFVHGTLVHEERALSDYAWQIHERLYLMSAPV